MKIDEAVAKIEKIMMYRGELPEEGKLRKILEAVNTPTNKPSTKSCATCKFEGDGWGVCRECCYRCLSKYTRRKTSRVG